MSATHDYDTKKVASKDLNSTMVLVGESGGLSAVYNTYPSSIMPGTTAVETEHGTLYAEYEELFTVLDI